MKKTLIHNYVNSRKPLLALAAVALLVQPVQATVPPPAEEVADVAFAAATEPAKEAKLIAIAAIEEPLIVQEELLDVCTEAGYGEDCARTLLGMLWKESMNVHNAIGDRGKARGYFQIWVKLHKISVECAEDLRCSAEWTLRHLERKGYPKRLNAAVQCHNGCGIANGYAASALRHGKRLWDKPMPVETDAINEVAVK